MLFKNNTQNVNCLFKVNSISKKKLRNPLIGKWEYVDCTIKNTGVRGIISFKEDGTFKAEVKMREDHPTPSKSVVKGSYKVKGNEVEYDDLKFDSDWYQPHVFGKFFLIEGAFLSF